MVMQCMLSASPHAQVVIARVISIDHDALRMRLSLAPKTGNPAAETAAGDPAGGLQPGDLVQGVIANITSKEVCSSPSAQDSSRTSHNTPMSSGSAPAVLRPGSGTASPLACAAPASQELLTVFRWMERGFQAL